MKMHFICVGPQRTGTSWLDRALRTHPDLCLPRNCKETFFFDRYYSHGLKWYAKKYFSFADSLALKGEVGPTYFHKMDVVERLRECNDKMKIIIIVRDPVERTYSLYNLERTKGRLNDDLMVAIEHNPWILESGHYAWHIPMWMDAFGKGNVLVITQQYMERHPECVYRDVQNFLGVRSVMRLPVEVSTKYGESTVPKYPRLAKVAAWSATRLRASGLHALVEIGKRAGMKNVYRGGDPGRLLMSQKDRMFLEAKHQQDYEYLVAHGYLA